MLNRLKQQKKKGFTLVELIVVIVIILILAAVLVPSLLRYVDRANEARASEDIHTLVTAIDIALVDTYAEHNLDVDGMIIYSPPTTPTSSFERTLITNLQRNLTEAQFSRINYFVIYLPSNTGNVSSFDDAILNLRYTTESGVRYVYTRQNGQETIEKR